MKKLTYLKWNWNNGKVKFWYKTETNQKKNIFKRNDNPPPTRPAHDISHFICGFNGLEWDFTVNPTYISEYNAVLMEHILHHYCSSTKNNVNYTYEFISERINDYVGNFFYNYYKIQSLNPNIPDESILRNRFFEAVDEKVVCKHFMAFYEPWVKFDKTNSFEFDMTITLDNKVDYFSDSLYDYLIKIKPLILNKKYNNSNPQ